MGEPVELAEKLKPGKAISNRLLMNIFKCACEGGIRYSSTTDTIVLVLNRSIYPGLNRLDSNILEFIGQGKSGDQTLTRMNKRLAEFMAEKKPIYVFEAGVPGQYRYLGKASRLADPFQKEIVEGAKKRKVWVFPLQLMHES